MRHATVRLGLLLLAALFSVGAACPGPVCDPDAPVCTWAECAEHAACAGAEICDNEIDDDGDLDIDADDADCVEEFSPVTAVDCVAQDTETVAGDDIDTIVDPDDCEDPVASDAGDGDTAQVLIAESDQGAVEVAIDIANGDPSDPAPAATSTITIRVGYEAGGERVILSTLGASPNGDTVTDASCESLGYQIDIDGRAFVPTDPDGGEFFCTVQLGAFEAGSYRVLVGSLLAQDDDGDGTSNRNDVYCPEYGEDEGCEEHGFYAGVEYFCPDADSCHFDSFPTPGFCNGTCTVVTEHAIVQVDDEDESILVESDGDVRLEGGTAQGVDDGWSLDGEGASSAIDTNGAVSCFDPSIDDPDFCDLQVESHQFGCPARTACRIYADPAALASEDPLSVTIDTETTDEAFDGVFSFVLESNGSLFDAAIETEGGVGTSSIVFVFADEATVTENATPGFEILGHDCPGDGAVAELTGTAACLWRNEPIEVLDFVTLTVVGPELAYLVPANFADLGGGERIAVAGANGVGVYETSTFSLVPGLSEINGFNLRNVLGSAFLDAPGSANDGRFSWFTPSGSLTTQWFPEIPGFGASLFGFGAVRDLTYVEGDPSRALSVSGGTAILEHEFIDAGLDWPLLNATSIHSGAPAGYSITSAVQTSTSNRVLFTAQNNTAGAPGGLFLVNPGSAPTPIGDLGVRPLLLRGVETAPGTWIGVATSFESNEAHVITWDGADAAAIADSFATGEGPLVPAVWRSENSTIATVSNFGADSATFARIDAATGAVTSSVEMPAHPSCGDPGSVLVVQQGARIVFTCRATNGLWIVDPVQIPWP